MRVDVEIEDAGTVALIRALSRRGQRWMHHNLPVEDWQRLGPFTIAAEPRCARDIAGILAEDGLEVSRC